MMDPVIKKDYVAHFKDILNFKIYQISSLIQKLRLFSEWVNPILDTRISVREFIRLCVTLRLPPPWILKRGGLESSGQIA